MADGWVGRLAEARCWLFCVAVRPAGETGFVGYILMRPHLVSIGASAPLDYLIAALLDPDRKI